MDERGRASFYCGFERLCATRGPRHRGERRQGIEARNELPPRPQKPPRSPRCSGPHSRECLTRVPPGRHKLMSATTLSSNVMHFARLLRRAGLPVGPSETIAAQNALTQIDFGSTTETRTALRTGMIHRHEHHDVFDQAFALFWRDPSAAEQAAAMALLDAQKKQPERPPPASRRVAEAFTNPNAPKPKPEH